MQTSLPPLVFLTELYPGSIPLGTLRSIIAEANIGIEYLPLEDGNNADAIIKSAAKQRPLVVILSLNQADLDTGGPLRRFLSSSALDTPVILAVQDIEASQIRQALDLGVTDFVHPPFTTASVLPRLWRLLRHSSFESNGSLQEKLAMHRLGLLGESPLYLEEIRKLSLISKCDITVMIWGETGTGKELVARAVHYLSPRSDRPFVPIDCGAIPPELTESELFGHERGAFTGAVTKHRGLIAAADQGTLFLDEIDALSLPVQAKLLRFLQEFQYRPLGSNEIRKADVRVISATNSDLQRKVQNGEFREDLFYRLNVVQLRLPALRQRQEDVALLARHFVAKYSARFSRSPREFSRAALQKLHLHEWPGNIRELENVIESAVALCDGPLIRASDLVLMSDRPETPRTFREAKARVITEFEREYVVRLLCACGGNISEAARAAGKNRRAFWELVKKHEIDVRGLRESSPEGTTRPSAYAAGLSAR
jgi:two-component system response regulator GlrR